MRNLFEEYGYSKFDIENKVIDCWNEIFDPKNPNHFYFDAPDNTGYMEDTGNDDARTEGMSYGMTMALQMNRKDIFDRIWKWARANMYLEDGPNKGLFRHGVDLFRFYVSPDRGIYYSDSTDLCSSSTPGDDDSCENWVLSNGNLDYLKADSSGKCPNGKILNWTTNTSCK